MLGNRHKEESTKGKVIAQDGNTYYISTQDKKTYYN